MPSSVVSVKLTEGQVKKLRSKSAKECGTTITLKPALIAAAAPGVAKAAALGAVGTAAGMALKKATGKGYKKKG